MPNTPPNTPKTGQVSTPPTVRTALQHLAAGGVEFGTVHLPAPSTAEGLPKRASVLILFGELDENTTGPCTGSVNPAPAEFKGCPSEVGAVLDCAATGACIRATNPRWSVSIPRRQNRPGRCRGCPAHR